MQPNVYSSIIDNCQDMEATKVSINTVQSLSHVRLFTIPWTEANQASLSITNSGSLLRLKSIKSVMPSHTLSSPSPPAFNLSQHQGLFK